MRSIRPDRLHPRRSSLRSRPTRVRNGIHRLYLRLDGAAEGVAIEQRHIIAYLNGLQAETVLPDGAQYALASTFAADLGHTPVLAALTSGGCVHVIPSSLASDIERLADHFASVPVDCVKIAPTHLNALCRAFPADAGVPWRCAIVGGEPLKWELVSALEGIAPHCTIVNEYGPTETTVGVLTAVAHHGSDPYVGLEAPIGRPRPDVRAYVLDRGLERVPRWMPGELYIEAKRSAADMFHSLVSLLSDSFPIHSAQPPAPPCTVPATSPDIALTVRSSSSGGVTVKSKCAAIGSS